MEAEAFSISTTSLAECELLTVRGELDRATAPDLEFTSTGVAGDRPLVIDISGVEFLDSRGIHALMQAAGNSRKVALVCPSGNVSRVLAIVRMEQVMPLYENLEAALAELR